MDEFQLIEEIFAPLAPRGAPAFGLRDDAAVFDPPPGRALVFTKDLMIAGVHFPVDEDASLVGRKLLRVNLSDLAAMGAVPRGYLLGLAAGPDTGVDWLRAFAGGLAEDQKTYEIELWGGDTVASAAKDSAGLVLSLTAIGSVPRDNGALRRGGANIGDLIFVSGTIGDGALGLKCVQGDMASDDFLMTRYRLPTPRLALGQTLVGLATSCIDVSDGLLADLAHLTEVSGSAAEIERDAVPLSDAARGLLAGDAGFWPTILAGGDDYELLFTAPPELRDAITAAAEKSATPVTEIGMIAGGSGVQLLDEAGNPLKVDTKGFQHQVG